MSMLISRAKFLSFLAAAVLVLTPSATATSLSVESKCVTTKSGGSATVPYAVDGLILDTIYAPFVDGVYSGLDGAFSADETAQKRVTSIGPLAKSSSQVEHRVEMLTGTGGEPYSTDRVVASDTFIQTHAGTTKKKIKFKRGKTIKLTAKGLNPTTRTKVRVSGKQGFRTVYDKYFKGSKPSGDCRQATVKIKLKGRAAKKASSFTAYFVTADPNNVGELGTTDSDYSATLKPRR